MSVGGMADTAEVPVTAIWSVASFATAAEIVAEAITVLEALSLTVAKTQEAALSSNIRCGARVRAAKSGALSF